MPIGMELGPGMLFIGTPGQTLTPLGETAGSVLEYDSTAYESEEAIETIRVNEPATFEAELTPESIVQIAETFMCPVRGFLRIRDDKSIRRMAHLGRHARKARTRRKNALRMWRACWEAGKI